MPASLMMKPQKPPRAASSPANGSLVMNLTAYLPAGSTLSTAMKSDLPGDFSKSRSNVNFTSAEVSSWPSWNFTPSRSLKAHVSPSGLVCHDSASSGTGVMSGSKRTSWLYIIGERRLRQQPEVGERGFDEDRLRQGDGALHDERRDHVGQDVLEGHGQARGAERAHGLHVVLGALGQHGAAHHAREDRRVHDGDGQHRAVDAGAPQRGDAHGQEQPGDAEEDVEHPVDGVVDGAAEVARGQPEGTADGHRGG